MPPRIAYWASSFEPGMEAVANEIAVLRRRFRNSLVWGLSHRHNILISRHRGYCLHPRYHLLFRAATRLFEPAFHIHHIFGSLGDWFYLEGRGRRPTVLTLATASEPASRDQLDHVDRFVAESPRGLELLRRLGYNGNQCALVFPPVDLTRFRPAPRTAERPVVLFASSPDRADWLEGRGIPLLLQTAGLMPGVRFRLLWRPWGDSTARMKQLLHEGEFSNVELVVTRQRDMAGEYAAADITIAPFVDRDKCKPVPNSLLESMASGRPVVATSTVEIAEVIEEGGAGVITEPEPERLAAAIDRVLSGWTGFSSAARRTAEKWFGQERFIACYEAIYGELM